MSYDIEIRGKGSFIFDENRAKVVAQRLVEIYDDSNSIMGRTIPPQIAHIPSFIKPESKELAQHYLAVSVADYITSSEYIYPGMKTVSEARYKLEGDYLFDPLVISSFSNPNEFQEYIESLKLVDILGLDQKNHGGRVFKKFKISPAAKYKYIYQNAELVLRDFDLFGDVRSLNRVLGTKSDNILNYISKKENFKGLGLQTGALFMRFLYNANLLELDDPENLLVKVDRHKLKFPFATKMFRLEELFENSLFEVPNIDTQLIPKVQPIYSRMAELVSKSKRERVVVRDKIDESIWRINESLCSQRNIDICFSDCPIYDLCEGLPFVIEGDTTHESKRRRKMPNQSDLLFENFSFKQRPKLGLEGNLVDMHSNNTTFYDRNTGLYHNAQGWRTIYPKVDCREGELETSEQLDLIV